MPSKENDPSELTDHNLIEQAKLHNEDAWKLLVELHGPLVDLWIAQSNLSNADRNDIFQEVFMTVARRINSFNFDSKKGSFRGWLRTITRSRVVDHLRKQGKTVLAEGGEKAWKKILDLPDQIDSSNEPQAMTRHQAEQRKLLLAAMEIIRDRVQAKTWDAFWKVAVEEQAVADVSEELGISPSGVRLAKSRVLRRLRKLLSE